MPMLRLIVACNVCGRQFDASEREIGSSFRCSCGTRILVPAPRPHEAAVVRCSSCGAPRLGQAARCSFCDADFTLREQDLDTLCPHCMARTSGRSSFCHHCGCALLVEELARDETRHPCPACGPDRLLESRRLGQEQPFSVLECRRCGGLWVGKDLFRLLADSAQRLRVYEQDHGPGPARPTPQQANAGALYRPCPLCSMRMNRQNYGRRSGVILDVCRQHGVWCDTDELDRVLAWIRSGGLEGVKEDDALDARRAAREHELKRQADLEEEYSRTSYPQASQLERLVTFLGNLVGAIRS